MPVVPRSPSTHRERERCALSQVGVVGMCVHVSSTPSLSHSRWDCSLSKCQPTCQAIRVQNVIHSLNLHYLPRLTVRKDHSFISLSPPLIPQPFLLPPNPQDIHQDKNNIQLNPMQLKSKTRHKPVFPNVLAKVHHHHIKLLSHRALFTEMCLHIERHQCVGT